MKQVLFSFVRVLFTANQVSTELDAGFIVYLIHVFLPLVITKVESQTFFYDPASPAKPTK